MATIDPTPALFPNVGWGLGSWNQCSTTTFVSTAREASPEGRSLQRPKATDPAWVLSVMPTPPESPPPPTAEIKTTLSASSTTQHSLHNLLQVSTRNPKNYFLTRQCCYVFHCLSLKVNFRYQVIPNETILQDDRVRSSLEAAASAELDDRGPEENKDEKSYRALLARHRARANHLLNAMKTAMSTSLLRLTGYVLFKVFNRLLMSVTVNRGQLEVIEKASSKDIPLIFVPLHRSHVDYLFVTWVLLNLEIPAPIVAAGDNLRIPVFGCLLRGLGGFFIKRRLESTKSRKDVVYRSVLQTYISHSLQAGYNMEFFIEGGRTRTGKPCMPKGGLLSVIVDAYMNGALHDALVVPIAINYDKILDGNFIKEQLGQNKVPETFWGATRAIIKVLCTNYGYARIDFGQPFSLKEFVHNAKLSFSRSSPPPNTISTTPPDSPSSICDVPPKSNIYAGHHRSLSSPPGSDHLSLVRTQSHPLTTDSSSQQNGCLVGARSNSSLFGTEVNDEYRQLVNSLASHIVYDAERCQAIMSTNAVAWLLSFAFREGTDFEELTQALDSLRETLQARGRDTGFSGETTDVLLHAVKLMGSSLVRLEKNGIVIDNQSFKLDDSMNKKAITITPVTLLPNVIELNYYANALTPLFVVDSIVSTSILTMVDCNIWSYKSCQLDILLPYDKIISRATRLAEILRYEFLYTPSCGRLEDKIRDALDRLVYMGFLSESDTQPTSRWTEEDSDSDFDNGVCRRHYTVTPTSKSTEVVGVWVNMLTPLLDAYYSTARKLRHLVRRQSTDKQFIMDTKDLIQTKLEDGTFTFGESISADPIRNAIKYFEQEKILDSSLHDTTKILFLRSNFNCEEHLEPIISEINSYRSPHCQ